MRTCVERAAQRAEGQEVADDAALVGGCDEPAPARLADHREGQRRRDGAVGARLAAPATGQGGERRRVAALGGKHVPDAAAAERGGPVIAQQPRDLRERCSQRCEQLRASGVELRAGIERVPEPGQLAAIAGPGRALRR